MAYDGRMRKANAIAAAAVTVFFVAHSLMGALALHVPIERRLAVLAFAACTVVAAHIVLSIETTRLMYTDVVRPPSEKKKRHQVLKWVSGAVLLAVAAAHIVFGDGSPPGELLMAALAAAFAVHVWIGMKSVLKDLGLRRELRTPLRVVVVALCVVAGAAALFAIAG